MIGKYKVRDLPHSVKWPITILDGEYVYPLYVNGRTFHNRTNGEIWGGLTFSCHPHQLSVRYAITSKYAYLRYCSVFQTSSIAPALPVFLDKTNYKYVISDVEYSTGDLQLLSDGILVHTGLAHNVFVPHLEHCENLVKELSTEFIYCVFDEPIIGRHKKNIDVLFFGFAFGTDTRVEMSD